MKTKQISKLLALYFGHWRDHVSLDTRSLALWRIGLGLLLIADLLGRASDLVAHYSDAGVLPRAVLLEEHFRGQPYFSVHLWGGSALFQGVLFAVAGALALALTLGYRTRAVTVLSWLFLVSLHNRNPLINNAGDTILRLMLLWSCFLPLGARFSLDGLRARKSRVAGSEGERFLAFSWGSAGFIFQLGFVYFFSALYKTNAAWTQDLNAISYALRLETMAKPLASELLRFPEALSFFTLSTFHFELWGPILVLLCSARGWLRTFWVAAFIAFHVGLGLFLDIGLFPWICSAAWLALLPTAFWNFLARRRALVGVLNRIGFVAAPSVAPKGESGAEVPLRLGWPGQAMALFLLLYITLWNTRGLYPAAISPILPASWNDFGQLTRVAQRWKMFASPARRDGWLVGAATQRSGAHIDLLAGGPLSWQKPASVWRTHRNSRWRKYSSNLTTSRRRRYRPAYAEFLAREWNRNRPPAQQVVRLDLYYLREENRPDGTNSAPQNILLIGQEFVP